ncbi:sulfate permease [Chitinibacter sp. SCUT-21]|uniref:SulP family inorganic anion transporter n=1 Tax=Chitinibacter sp. SCUT-21 TaxID=2970891 RepID=UPI0035A63CF4
MHLQPPLWIQQYRRAYFAGDFIASIIVALLLIPQGLAYAQLAGLPPMAGLFASIAPLLIYGFFGSSMTQSVGPMAITSAMTATALTPLAAPGSAQYLILAATLSLLSGLLLSIFGLLKLGQITRFLSLPVVQGFSAGTALLIALGQVGGLVGTVWRGDTLPALMQQLPNALNHLQVSSLAFGLSSLLLMWLSGAPSASLLRYLGINSQHADLASKVLPLLTMLLIGLALASHGGHAEIKTLGNLNSLDFKLQSFSFAPGTLQSLFMPALLIGLAGFLQSITVAQSIANSRQQHIDANRELLALGNCNIAAAAVGGMPVSGGFSRTVVNTNAGAQTPLAGMLSAIWIIVAICLLLPLLSYLPTALLAATIILATSKMISLAQLKLAWQFDRRDGIAWIMTFAGVLLTGPMTGIAVGVGIAILLYLLRSQQPHIAVVGRVPQSEHYRNVLRHQVETTPSITAIRIDENLFFANISTILGKIDAELAQRAETSDLVLILSAVNNIDFSAVNALKSWLAQLNNKGIALHLAEVKGPVLDTLKHGDFLQQLQNPPFISTHAAMLALQPQINEDYTI